jgi:hypothetical protein
MKADVRQLTGGCCGQQLAFGRLPSRAQQFVSDSVTAIRMQRLDF